MGTMKNATHKRFLKRVQLSVWVVIVLGLVSFGLLLGSNWLWQNNIRSTVPLYDNLAQARMDFTKGQLLLERLQGGDQSLRIEDVMPLFDQAELALNDCVRGRSTIIHLEARVPENQELLHQLTRLKSGIKALQESARYRLKHRRFENANDLLKERSNFYELEQTANAINYHIHQHFSTRIADQNKLHTFTLGLWMVILVAACGFLFHAGIKRVQAEAALRKARDELEKLVEVRTAELVEANKRLRREIEERKQAEAALQSRTHELGERVKELNCLYDISKLLENPDILLAEILERIVNLIPAAWQYPHITCAKITLYDQTYTTKNFKETGWKHNCDIIVDGNRTGTLEVYLLEEKSEEPFLKEEKKLLIIIAERLGKIVERKHMEKALRESERRYRSLFNSVPIGLYRTKPDGRILDVNPAIVEILGYPDRDSLQNAKTLETYVNPEDRKRLNLLLKENGFVRDFTVPLRRRDGTVVWVNIHARVVHDADDKTMYYEGAMKDISDRRQAEEQIHTLSQQLIKAQETERQMISRELHDRVAQDLSTLKIGLETLFDNQAATTQINQKISNYAKILQETIVAVRDISYELRPPGLKEMGLVETIYHYCEDFSENHGVSVHLSTAGMDNIELEPDTEINLYRLIQEGLNNIRKHAEAGSARVKLIAASPNIILRIEDDGKGFDMEKRLRTTDSEKRMGLRSMAERVNLLQGQMRVHSRPLQGTKIFIKVPYQEKMYDSKKDHHHR
jgi:PAS domain S-box-containing protein